jgi:hypothetical protein
MLLAKFRVILGLLALFSATTVMADTDAELRSKVQQLNKHSTELLGISIHAVKYLLEIEEPSFVPLSYLKEQGQFKYLKELEAAGYARIVISNGLPDGRFKDKEFVTVMPAELGLKLARQLANVQHNQ